MGDTAHNASSSPSRRDRTLTALGDLDHLISTADKAVQRDCPLQYVRGLSMPEVG